MEFVVIFLGLAFVSGFLLKPYEWKSLYKYFKGEYKSYKEAYKAERKIYDENFTELGYWKNVGILIMIVGIALIILSYFY